MISQIPESLQAYKQRISELINSSNDLAAKFHSYKSNLLRHYKEINESAMNKVISDARLTVESVAHLSNDIADLRSFIPFHLRIPFDKCLNVYQMKLEKEKSSYFETENRTLSLLKNLSLIEEDQSKATDIDYGELCFEDYEDRSDELADELEQCRALEQQLGHVNDLFVGMDALVREAEPTIDEIEENVAQSNESVTGGTKQLISASRLKRVALPIGTTVIGALIGGPVGLVVGLKAGLVASVCGAVCGSVGGSMVTKHNLLMIKNSETSLDNLDKKKAK